MNPNPEYTTVKGPYTAWFWSESGGQRIIHDDFTEVKDAIHRRALDLNGKAYQYRIYDGDGAQMECGVFGGSVGEFEKACTLREGNHFGKDENP